MRTRLTRRATRDIAGAAAFIRRESPAAAKRVRAAVDAAIDLLGEHPEAGRLIDARDVRRLVVPHFPYLIYYRIDHRPDCVVILAIQHPARSRNDRSF